jgi:RNA polymerase sigma-54 factor
VAIELRQQLKLTQQLVMTPQLQLAIKLLQMSRLELIETIQQEMEENPVLEESREDLGEEVTAADSDREMADQIEEVQVKETIQDDIDWQDYINEFNAPSRTSYEVEAPAGKVGFENYMSSPESLQDHLLWQLLMTSADAQQKLVGSLIIGNLNNDGYLDISVEEIAQLAEVSIDLVKQTLAVMQTFDPVGVCARDLGESLLIQLKHLGIHETLVTEIVSSHIGLLQNRNVNALCKKTGASRENVLAAVAVIQGLEPRPGRAYSAEVPQHIVPDIYVYQLDGDFIIVLNDNGLPRLHISALYRNRLQQIDQISASEKEYIQDKLRAALWLIRSIHKRQKTIYRVMESIIKFQRPFFERGIGHLKPMVLRDVAEDIDMHESTVSRVTTNKYAHTPHGVFELKYFFSSPINRVDGKDAVASTSVKDKIRQIIEGENPIRPYSDNKITQILKAFNIDIARRTVGKYREALNILPSSKRKKLT